MRTGGGCRTVDREISRFPRKERLHMPGSLTTPGRPGARADAPGCIAFHNMHGVGTRDRTLSRLNGWPMRSPVNASPRPSRTTAHDSGPMWIAIPSSQGTCTLYSSPVSRRFAYFFRFTPRIADVREPWRHFAFALAWLERCSPQSRCCKLPTLKRVPTGANVEDYDVLCGGEVVGRIFLSQAGKWMWLQRT